MFSSFFNLKRVLYINTIIFIFLLIILLGTNNCAKRDEESIVINLSLILGENSEWYKGAAIFKRLVEKQSGNRIKVQLFPLAQLAGGNQRSELEMVQSGAIDASLESSILLSLIDQRWSVFSLPWMFRDYDEANLVLNSTLGERMLEFLADKNLVGLAYGVNGFRQITNSRRPVRTPEDLKALKIRVPGIKMYIDLFKHLGADPSSMNFGEVFTALSQKTMDGQENPLTVINSRRLYEVQDYLSIWDYSFDPIILCMNKSVWERYDEKDRELIRSSALEAMSTQWEMVLAAEDSILGILKEKGMKVSVLSQEERELFSDRVAPVWNEYRDIIGEDLLNAFSEFIARLRSGEIQK